MSSEPGAEKALDKLKKLPHNLKCANCQAFAQHGHGAVVMALAGGAFAKAEDGTRCTCRATATASDPLTKKTPLHLAAERGRAAVVAPLAAAGAVVDAADGDGVPPLVYAVRAGHAPPRPRCASCARAEAATETVRPLAAKSTDSHPQRRSVAMPARDTACRSTMQSTNSTQTVSI